MPENPNESKHESHESQRHHPIHNPENDMDENMDNELDEISSPKSGDYGQQFLELLLATNTFRAWFIRGTLLTTGGLILFLLLNPGTIDKVILAYVAIQQTRSNEDTPYLTTNRERIITYVKTLNTDLTLLYLVSLDNDRVANLAWSNHPDASDALNLAPGSLLRLLDDPVVHDAMDSNNCIIVKATDFSEKLDKLPGRGVLCPIRRKGKISSYVFLLYLYHSINRLGRPKAPLTDLQVIQYGNSLATFIEGLP